MLGKKKLANDPIRLVAYNDTVNFVKRNGAESKEIDKFGHGNCEHKMQQGNYNAYAPKSSAVRICKFTTMRNYSLFYVIFL
jgi:hypothetical protein